MLPHFPKNHDQGSKAAASEQIRYIFEFAN
jgi:hypothetical protein